MNPSERNDPMILSIAALVGENCARLRRAIGITQDQLARYARQVGLRWTASKVGDFEHGRSEPTFATLLGINRALQLAFEESSIADWPSGIGLLPFIPQDSPSLIKITDTLCLTSSELNKLCHGDFTPYRGPRPLKGIEGIRSRSGLTERNLAKRLGISREQFSQASFQLWERTFGEERDQRVAPGSTQQKRGRVSRDMLHELRQALSTTPAPA